jgi:hypothetical protein
MNMVHDYESMGFLGEKERFTPSYNEVPELILAETIGGSQIVSWYSMIEDFLQRKLDDQEAARNHENADRLRAFLNTWRDNELTGSVNIDDLKPLKAAAEQQAAVKSPLRPIFSSLLRNLRKLVADEEALPRGIDQNAVDPMSAGLGRGAPPMSPDFGAEEEPPPGMGAEGEMPLGAEGDLGAGMEGTPPEGTPGAEKVMTAADTEPGRKPRPRQMAA